MVIRVLWGLMVLALCVCVSGVGAAAEDVATLTLKEQVGAARVNEPVRMGIPLAEGVFKTVDQLALVDAAGRPIPVQFTPVARWLKDKSIRWVHAVFQASVPANGKSVVKLVKARPAQTAGRMKVTAGADKVTVSNGLLELVVKGPGFNLFDSVKVNGAEVVGPHGEGIVVVLDGETYRPGDDSKVTVEESGSEGAVLKVAGKLVDGADGPFVYTCYIHVFQGSPEVRVDFTYTNARGGEPKDHVKMEDLSVVLPTTLKGLAVVGGEKRTWSGKSAKAVAMGSDLCHITVDGDLKPAAKGKSRKATDLGWAAVGTAGRGVAVGVRWFWQMHPKAVEAGADGKLRVGLFAREAAKPLDVYMGQGRTHYLTFRFGEGDTWTAPLANVFAGRQMPLRAACTPKYYCRVSRAFGPVADADPALYEADLLKEQTRYNQYLRQSVERIEKKIEGHTYRGVQRDSYGYYPFGDVFHWANTSNVEDPWNVLWESNYYDYPWAALVQFARTGDLLYLDICDRHGLHIADVFMCKWHPKKKLRGACRYSPPANHVGLDRDYRKPKPYVSVEFNHHKARSILHRHLLLGDLVARDHFMLALNNATLNPEASWRQCRGPGSKLATLASGYRLTHSPLHLAKIKECVHGARRYRKSPRGYCGNRSSGYFMMGIAAEGLVNAWWLTGDKETFDTVRAMCDFLEPECGKKNSKYITTNMTLAYALMYRETGEKKYRDAAVKLLKLCGVQARPKGFGQQWRNCGFAWHYLSKLGAEKAD